MNANKAKLLLLTVFAARGASFLFSKALMQHMSPLSVLAVRFVLAFTVLAAVFAKKLIRCGRQSLRGGVVLGVLYTVCMVFEMYGLRLIDSGVASLIENMAIIIVPVYTAVLTRTLPKRKTLLCASLAVVGVGCLSVSQSKITGGGLGVLLMVLAAMAYAACIMTTEKISQNADPVTVGIIQLGTMGTLCLLLSLANGSFCLPNTGNQWNMMILLVLLCSCFGFAFQPVGQKYVPAETAAVFTVINPLAASLIGVLVADEVITIEKLVGFIVILTALVLYNLQEGKTAESRQDAKLRKRIVHCR